MVAGNSEAVTLSGLKPDTQYQVTVAAVWAGKKYRSRPIVFRTLGTFTTVSCLSGEFNSDRDLFFFSFSFVLPSTGRERVTGGGKRGCIMCTGGYPAIRRNHTRITKAAHMYGKNTIYTII